MTHTLDSDKEAQAAEYVLGVLEDAERRRFEARLTTDGELAAHVDAWQERLNPMTEFTPAVAPSPLVWRRIETAIGPAHRTAEPPASVSRLWDRIAFWRWSTAGTVVAAAVAALVLLNVPAAPPTAPAPRIATLTAGAEPTSWLITVDVATGEVEVRPLGDIAVSPGRDLELWLIPAGGAVPRSLGLLEPDAVGRLTLGDEITAAAADATALAISLEPAGGSPTGAPTGPVLYQGPLLSL